MPEFEMDAGSMDPFDRLDAFLSEVVRTRGATEPASADLDPALAETVRRVASLAGPPPPSPAFARRLREDLMHQADLVGTVRLQTPPAIALNGRPTPRPWRGFLPALPGTKERRRLAYAQFATVVMLLITLLGIYFTFWQPEQRIAIPPDVGTSPPATLAADVPMFRGDPARTGTMPGPAPQEPVGILWRSPLLETSYRIWSSPAVADGLVYIGTASLSLGSPRGALHALDAATGQERWRFDTEGYSMPASPAVVDGVVYTAADNGVTGFAYALDAQTGQERWRTEIGSGQTLDGPIVADGLVHLCNESAVVTLDAATGTERWSLPLAPLLCHNLAVADGVLYVPTMSEIERSGDLLALDPETGQERWRLHLEDGLSSIAVVDGIAYLGLVEHAWAGVGGGFAAVDLTTRTLLWRYDDPDGKGHGSPVVADGVVYVGDASRVRPGILYAFDAATGTVRWTAPLNEMLYSSPAMVDGVVYVGSGNSMSGAARGTQGIIYAIDAATGNVRWQLVLAEQGGIVSSPAVVGGVIYVGCDDGHVYALGHVEGRSSSGSPTPAQ